MASHLEEEMQSELESSVELLPKNGPITYNLYGSLVALVVEDESPETKENVDEADERVETEVESFNRFAVWQIYISPVFTKILLSLYLQCFLCKTKCSRKKTARSAGCPCRNADKK